MMAAGAGLRAQEITITLNPGWNWISYPQAVAMGIGEALGDFVPMEGDIFKSQTNMTSYHNGSWSGGLTQFTPGWGYMYYSARTEDIGFVFAYAGTSNVVLTTMEPADITTISAVVGGMVTLPEGGRVFMRGVCWGIEPNPDIDGNHTTEEIGVGEFTRLLYDLVPGTTYYVRAYALTDFGLVYGEELSFTTIENSAHDYVDLGLPSGTLWATCNVGADTPEGRGDYFAWGETHPKDYYSWETYKYCNGSHSSLTKYCCNYSYGNNGFTDDLTTLLPYDDAATTNWGPDWRMPTKEEWEELYNNTTSTWTIQNDVRGRLFTASNGNSIFLPVGGYRSYGNFSNAIYGYYWSSSLSGDPSCAWQFFFHSGDYFMNNEFCYRNYGQPVRAVRSSEQVIVPTGAIEGKFTINSDGDQVYFSQGNLQYQANTNTWRFATNQYDYVGSDNSHIFFNYSGWIDLFGWGTSGWDNGNTYYQPWSYNNYHGGYYGPSGQYDLTGSYANSDWGVYNPISNGGNQSNLWRTLTKAEWMYLLQTRTTSTGIRYAKAQVLGVNGMLLLPDDWSEEIYSLNNTNTHTASFTSNVISVMQWPMLERAGVVFLPAAGIRNMREVSEVGTCGYYWSTTSASISYNALGIYFNDSQHGQNNTGRFFGSSVRLVHDIE